MNRMLRRMKYRLSKDLADVLCKYRGDSDQDQRGSLI